MLLELLALFVVALLLVYRWSTASFNFFKQRGIPYNKPYPLVGSKGKIIFGKQSNFNLIIDLYNEGKGKVFGIFEQMSPVLMIRDPELIKQITVKDFDHFVNHPSFFGADGEAPHDIDHLFFSSLFTMRDARWRDMRSTLSPAFTGSKMRRMFELMNVVAKEAVDYLKRDPLPETGLELDMKDYSMRFTNDAIASTAFGLEVNSFKERENTFYIMGKNLTTFTFLQGLKFVFFRTAHSLFRLLKLPLFDRLSSKYLMDIVLDTMTYRKEHNIVRPDMIHLLMESRGIVPAEKSTTNTNRDWDDFELAAQCFVFFFAGLEMSSKLMCFAGQELMENVDVQQKLYAEIAEVDSQLDGGQVTYEALMGMKYLDQVISEVLRKWPPSLSVDRECNKDITYEVDGQAIEIKKGDCVFLPNCALQYDAKYFENPSKFDPERFSDENKHKINPFTYFPFGLGKRNCIGSRYALLKAKALIYYMLRDFRIEPAAKSSIPLDLMSAGLQVKPKDGFWIQLVARA
ncbi:hypothetical protein KR093_004285 [Drosophila rubida]|uniref:Cytochrome P450 9f2 n=1 Tax=Drosophila rubida TaxID=30044 RepID=A0AAD4KGK2_9MUSC|nr:hypothetical protein KR093_004285 [Drosophila rubida]